MSATAPALAPLAASAASAATRAASGVGSLKWIEVGLLLAAGIGFFWWQRRDLAKAKAESQRQSELQATSVARTDGAKSAALPGNPTPLPPSDRPRP